MSPIITIILIHWPFFSFDKNYFRYGRNILLIHFNTSKEKRNTIHWILQVCGAVFVLTGVTIQIISQIYLGKEHFGSIHSTFGEIYIVLWLLWDNLELLFIASIGLISAILLLFTMSSGWAALSALRLRERIKPIFNKLFHATVASVTFIGGMTTIILAYQTKPWIEQEDYVDFRTAMSYIISLITILKLIGAFRTLWCHVRNIILGRRCHYEVVP